MVISQVTQNLRGVVQLGILLSGITSPVRCPAIELQKAAGYETQQIQAQAGTKPCFVSRHFTRDEDVTRNQIATISNANHDPSSESSFGISAHVVSKPDDQDGHLDIRGRGDCEHAKVASRDGFDLSKFEGPANDADGGTKDKEAVPISDPAREIGAYEERHKRNNIHRDCVDLRLGVGVAEGLENSGLERDDGRSSIVGAKVSECSYADVSD